MHAARFVSTTSGSVVVADVNGDSIPDIVSNGISILLGDGTGRFSEPCNYVAASGGYVMLTDFDLDGNVDIVIGNGNPAVFTGDTLTVLFGHGGQHLPNSVAVRQTAQARSGSDSRW